MDSGNASPSIAAQVGVFQMNRPVSTRRIEVAVKLASYLIRDGTAFSYLKDGEYYKFVGDGGEGECKIIEKVDTMHTR
jgi:hypothetical protein